MDGAGNLFIVDTYNNRIRKVTPAGIISTVAGMWTGFSGNGGPAASAELNTPLGAAVDSAGTHIADTGNSRIQKVTPAGVISTIAGNGGRAFFRRWRPGNQRGDRPSGRAWRWTARAICTSRTTPTCAFAS